MAKSLATRPRARKDKLKKLLDELAEKAVSAVLADAEATPRGMADVLKVAGGYWVQSRKGEEAEPIENAWDQYHHAMNGKEADGATH